MDWFTSILVYLAIGYFWAIMGILTILTIPIILILGFIRWVCYFLRSGCENEEDK
jgi:hypothetical protein